MQMMNKKILAVALCLSLCGSLSACTGSDTQKAKEESPIGQDTQQAAAEQEEDRKTVPASEEGYLEESSQTRAMSDEELLAALGDNINVIAEDAYAETVNAFLDRTDDYVGKIYQLNGSFVKEGDNAYLAVNSGEESSGIRIPLKCLLEEPESGSNVRVTGIVNYGDVDGESVPVLDIAVLETIQE